MDLPSAPTVSRQTISCVRRLARFGYVAKGVVYMFVGFFASLAALDLRRRPADSRGALAELFQQPHGKVMLLLLGTALAFYAAWRFMEAVRPVEVKAPSHRVFKRLHWLLSGVIHAGFAITAFRLVAGGSAGPNADHSWRLVAATAMNQPFGRWLAFGAGLVVVGIGAHYLTRACRSSVCKEVERGDVPSALWRFAILLGRTGESARGFLFVVIGATVVQAALRYQPGRVRAFAGALQSLEQFPYGGAVLLVVAVGLFNLGLFLVLSARYQKI
jgi:hypothetical protein